jgi:hypothetical protein
MRFQAGLRQGIELIELIGLDWIGLLAGSLPRVLGSFF